MNYFSIPADFKLSTIDQLSQLNKEYNEFSAFEVYGQITKGEICNSGRVLNTLPDVDWTQLVQYVNYAKQHGIVFNYVFNPSCFGNQEFTHDGIKRIKAFLSDLWNSGITNLTLASPAIMETALSTGHDFIIKASAICEINSPSKALFYKKIGARRIVVDSDITRNFNVLRNICKVFGDGVEIIPNNVCLKNCPYKMFHYNHEAHGTVLRSDEIQDYFTSRCIFRKTADDFSYMKMCWIRPEDLHFYENCGIHNFKLQGRHLVMSGDVMKCLKAYFSRNYDGDLLELLYLFAPHNAKLYNIDNKKINGFIEKFYKSPEMCRDMCENCNYCKSFAKNSVYDNGITRTNSMVQFNIKEKDKFLNMIHIQ